MDVCLSMTVFCFNIYLFLCETVSISIYFLETCENVKGYNDML